MLYNEPLNKIAQIISSNAEKDNINAYEELVNGVTPFIEQCKGDEIKEKLLLRILNYIVYTHVFTKNEPTVDMYIGMVEVLFELTWPLALQIDSGSELLNDILLGIHKSKTDAKKYQR